MSTANPVNPMNAANAIGRCQLCGNPRQTAQAEFTRNVGMIVVRQTHKINANMCKTCLNKNYWEFMGKNLLLGPWGTISLIVTPIYFITNTVSYISAKKKLSGAVE